MDFVIVENLKNLTQKKLFFVIVLYFSVISSTKRDINTRKTLGKKRGERFMGN